MKLGGKILNKDDTNVFLISTHGAPTLVDFYIYVKLNKNILSNVHMN
jgi:hypothetical protein